MKIEIVEIYATAGFAWADVRVDGVLCRASERRSSGGASEIEVSEVRHPSPVILRGAEVPAEIVEAYREAVRQQRELCRAELADPSPGLTRSSEIGGVIPGGPHFLGREPPGA